IGCRGRYSAVPGLLSAKRELINWWVTDLFEGQSVRWHHPDRGVAHAKVRQFRKPVKVPATRPDGDQCADQRPHHRVTEGVSSYADLDHLRPAFGLQIQQCPDRAGALALTAEGSEVTQTEQGGGADVHGIHVDRLADSSDIVSTQRIRRHRGVAQPIDVATPDGGEPRFKTRWCGRYPTHHKVVLKCAVQPPGDRTAVVRDRLFR